MNSVVLYALTVLFWGSSWYAIRLQLTTVEPEVSVFYRFVLAAVVLFAFCVLTRKPMAYPLRHHLRFLVLGLFLFNLNFMLLYLATETLTSGIVAVVFSMVQIFNMINGAVALRDRVAPMMVVGALMGITGIALVFMPEFSSFSLQDETLFALLLALAGTLSASIGMIASASSQRVRLPVVQTNAWGMFYGALLMMVYIWFRGLPVSFDASPAYIGSLVYLAVFATVLGFGCFLTLVGRIGASKASYATVLFPIVALGISTVLEGYEWSVLAALGVALALAGNAVILLDKQRAKS